MGMGTDTGMGRGMGGRIAAGRVPPGRVPFSVSLTYIHAFHDIPLIFYSSLLIPALPLCLHAAVLLL